MQVIIISDIKGKSKSIIPYGLNLAKHLQAKVDIVHSIDSRTQHGVNSPYADSQSITPGNKLSHEEIMRREKNTSQKALDKLLSREASVLNFPLKVNTIIEENTLKKIISQIADNSHNTLVLVNSEPDNYIFHSQKELIETFNNSNLEVLVVPPGKIFREYNKVLLITDFSANNGFDKYSKADYLLRDFAPLINAVDVAESNNYAEKELKSKVWLQEVEKMAFSSTVKANVLTGNNYLDTVKNYVDKTKPDLVLSYKQNQGLFNNGNDNNLVKNLMNKCDLPVLY